MIGHGCPHFVLRVGALLIASIAVSPASDRALLIASRPCYAQETHDSPSGPPNPQPGSSISTKLRFSWGGGTPQSWQGKITLESGAILNIAPLGVAIDATASVKKSGRDILIDHWSPTDYGGADVELEAPLDSKVHYSLTSTENPETNFEQTTTVGQLLGQTAPVELDNLGNRFSCSRAPGDSLRVKFDKPHLVFKPGESFRFSIQPMLTGLGTRTANCRLKVVLAGSSGVGARTYYAKTIPFALDGNGSSDQPIEVEIPIPKQEEIYNIELDLEPVWYQASFGVKSNSIKRSIQFIVLNQHSEDAVGRRNWREVSISDPADFGEGWSRTGNVAWNQIPKLGRSGMAWLGNNRTTTTVGQDKLLRLAAGGWQAIPLNVGRVGEPHVIEVEYVSREAVAIGMSLLQPDASGQIPLYGFDSGLYVPDSLVKTDPGNSGQTVRIERHRITVWPSTKTPYLLVVNRNKNDAAMIGKVRVFAGPAKLLPNEPKVSSGKHSRKLMAFYESPLFAENFGALATMDTDLTQPLDDWRMFYLGAQRLIEYLKANSYRGAFITVACDGSSIFPSQHLASTPKHDNGVFFSSGQDPVRKDVLEMLFQMFKREGLTLVPSLALSSPQPAIEALRESGSGTNEAMNGFDLVDVNLSIRQRNTDGLLPVYNPLDNRVQQSVTKVVKEIAGRYKQHSSFDGIAIVCRPDTYSLLPGRQWGYDNATVKKFIASQSDLIEIQPDEVRGMLTTTLRKQWIQWRAQQMTLWYQTMLSAVRASLPAGKLYLAPIDLYRNQETASALSPSLHVPNDFNQVMLNTGFDLERLQKSQSNGQLDDVKGLVLLNPHRVAPEETFSSQRVDYAIGHSPQAKRFFSKASYRGDLFTHRTAWAHFSQLQQQSPFGEQSSNLMRRQPLAPTEQFNRRRFVEAIKERDARLLVDGGPVISFGQEAALSDLMSVFNRLPDQPFDTVFKSNAEAVADSQSSLEASADSLPIAVRQLSTQSGAFFYVANASPWPIQLQLVIKTDQGKSPLIDSLSTKELIVRRLGDQSSTASTKGSFEVVFEVPAFGLVGGRSSTSGFSVVDFEFTLPEGADKVLKKQVYGLEAKLIKSKDPPPLNVLQNPDFESSGQPSLNGWDAGQQVATGKIRLSSSPDATAPGQVGAGALLMSNQELAPVWIRSNTFSGPKTARLSISVWLRIKEADSQPPLRLAVEGRSNGTDYYRFGSVGSLSPDPNLNQIDSKWKRFAVHFDDLPIEGLSDVRVGFDLMGPGEVLIDNVQLYDRWFDENDAKAITQMLASTGPLLSRPETIDGCRRLLESYWIQFLDRYVDDAGPTVVATEPALANARQANAQKKPADGPTTEEIYQPNEFENNEFEPNQGQVGEEKPRLPMFRRFRNMVPARKPQLR